MPKVEASFVEASALGGRMVPIEDLDRANAEIERVTKQRDRAINRFIAECLADSRLTVVGLDELLAKEFGVRVDLDGTVTEIDRE